MEKNIRISWVPMLLGLAIAFFLLAFVTKISFMGPTCYAVGEVNFASTYCLKPAFYWGAWAVAVVFVLLGISGRGGGTVIAIVVGAVLLVLGVAAYWYYTNKVVAPPPVTALPDIVEDA